MTDTVSKKVRSVMMSKVKSKNTKPELIVRSKLFNEGFRYRLHYKKLPGSPDIALPRFKSAIFVNGCFWHGHDCAKGRRPKSNKTFWESKINSNIKRDKKRKKEIEELEWKVFIVWECRLEKDLRKAIKYLEKCKSK